MPPLGQCRLTSEIGDNLSELLSDAGIKPVSFVVRTVVVLGLPLAVLLEQMLEIGELSAQLPRDPRIKRHRRDDRLYIVQVLEGCRGLGQGYGGKVWRTVAVDI